MTIYSSNISFPIIPAHKVSLGGMSFFENPFANDEAVVAEEDISDYPLSDYDSSKLENDYNELVVRHTTLEKQREETDSSLEARLGQCISKNQELRGNLTHLLSSITTCASSTSKRCVRSPPVANTESRKRIRAQSQANEGLRQQLEHSRREEASLRARLRAADASRTPASPPCAPASTLDMSDVPQPNGKLLMDAITALNSAPLAEHPELQRLAHLLAERLSTAIHAHTRESHAVAELKRRAAPELKATEELIHSISYLTRWYLGRQRSTPTPPPHDEAREHNRAVLRPALAALLDLIGGSDGNAMDGASSLPSDQVCAALGLAALYERAAELQTEVDTMGDEVLYRRSLLRHGGRPALPISAAPSSSTAISLQTSSSASCDSFRDACTARVVALESFVDDHHDVDSGRGVGLYLMEAEVCILSHVVRLQEVCLRSLAALHPFLEREATTTRVVQRLILAGEGLPETESGTMAASPGEEVLAACDWSVGNLAEELEVLCGRHAKEVAACGERWAAVRSLVAREWGLAPPMTPAEVTDEMMMSCVLEPHFAEEVEAEVAESEKRRRRRLSEMSESLRRRRKDLEAKRQWLGGLRAAVPLVRLGAAHAEREALTAQLAAAQEGSRATELTTASVEGAEEKVRHGQAEMVELEARLQRMEEELVRCRQRHEELQAAVSA